MLRRRCKSPVGWPSVFWGFLAMEKSFIVESKSFVFSVVEGASVLRVVKRRKDFLGEVILSTHCAIRLASILEVLLGFPADQDFVKSFREGSKLLIARRDSSKAARS